MSILPLYQLLFRKTYTNQFIKLTIIKFSSTATTNAATKPNENKRNFRVGLLQTQVDADVTKNLANAVTFIKKAKKEGADLVALGECFNSPYGVKHFPKYAENIPDGPTSKMLAKAAKDNCLYIVGGTFPEVENSTYYNTCTVWSPQGKLVAKYRKMHLFDIDIPGKITFKESEILTPGKEFATFTVNDIKIGLGICYDLRFEEFAKLYRLQGCDVLIYPGAFNLTTGPLHWELLQRARALDNQLYVLGICPARGKDGYIAWGHSQITSPWAKVMIQAGPEEEDVYCDLNFTECDEVRQQIPIYIHRRTDIYNIVEIKK